MPDTSLQARGMAHWSPDLDSQNASQALATSSARHAVEITLRAIPQALLVADPDGRVCCFNPVAEQLTGSTAAAVVGRAFGDVFVHRAGTEPSPAVALAEVVREARPASPVYARWQGGGSGARTPDLALTMSPIVDTDGTVCGVMVGMLDLRQQTGWEYIRSGFLALVSHELRSRLASISTSTELLLSLDLDAAESREVLAVVHAQSRRLVDYFERIMDADMLQSGEVIVRPEPVAVLPLVRGVVSRFETEAAAHRFFVTSDTSSPVASADEDKTETILSNLVENAVNYSPGGGDIVIDVRESGPDELVISVTDQGVGIPEEHLRDVFRRAHRVEAPGERPVRGHGLGLYIADGFARAQGGRIWAESSVGVGSTFRFTLPLLKDDAPT